MPPPLHAERRSALAALAIAAGVSWSVFAVGLWTYDTWTAAIDWLRDLVGGTEREIENLSAERASLAARIADIDAALDEMRSTLLLAGDAADELAAAEPT